MAVSYDYIIFYWPALRSLRSLSFKSRPVEYYICNRKRQLLTLCSFFFFLISREEETEGNKERARLIRKKEHSVNRFLTSQSRPIVCVFLFVPAVL